MTIQSPVSSSQRTSTGRPAVEMDISMLGAEVFDGSSDFGEDFPVETANLSKITAVAAAGLTDGLSGIILGPSFRLRSDTHLRDCRLDAVSASLKVHPRVTGPLWAAVSADAAPLHAAISAVKGKDIGLELHLRDASLDGVAECVAEARAAGVPISFALTGATASRIDIAEVGRLADRVRLRESDPHTAREIRFSLRSAALSEGRDLAVIADVFMVVSSCAMDAEERGELISAIGSDRYADGACRVLGTVHDVADHMEEWLAFGAADAFMILPGSLPTDLASAVKGVLPLLEARKVAAELDS